MKRTLIAAGLMSLCLMSGLTAHAQESVQVTSQPDEVAIFYNNVAFVRDTVQLPGGTTVQIALPDQVYAETLIVREDGRRVMNYTLEREGRLLIEWDSTSTEDTRTVTLQYLIAGLSWAPKYDLFIEGQEAGRVGFDFFAEIQNSVLNSEAVNVRLIAGSVALSTAYDGGYAAAPAMNQVVAGYAEAAPPPPVLTGSTTIQYIYEAGTLALETGETQYLGLLSTDLAARRLNLWNASYDAQVYSIYKVTNETDLPFADGLVRSYQDGMFLGTDGIELTPITSEGSVTVGTLQKRARKSHGEPRIAQHDFLQRAGDGDAGTGEFQQRGHHYRGCRCPSLVRARIHLHHHAGGTGR